MTPEEEQLGWEALRERWSDDEAHRAWLSGFTDLEGLARAGQRYRAALEANPGDAVAARWRDEILKRATVQGLASLPRTAPRPPLPRWVARAGVALVGALLVAVLWWAVRQLPGVERP
jgi:hypothetical protein